MLLKCWCEYKSPGNAIKMQISNSIVLEWDLRVCISYELPGDTKQANQPPFFQEPGWSILIHWIVFVSPTPLPWDRESGSGKEKRHSAGKCLRGCSANIISVHHLFLSHWNPPASYLLYKFQPLLLYLILCISLSRSFLKVQNRIPKLVAKGCIWSHRCFVLPSQCF